MYTCYFTTQMFKLNEQYEITRKNFKCDFLR